MPHTPRGRAAAERATRALTLSRLLLPLLLVGCGGSGSDEPTGGGGGGGAPPFAFVSSNVSPGAVWPIQGEIALTFSAPVDPASVTPETIAIRRADGTPAVGTYVLDPALPETVRFRPACPIREDLTDAGLRAGGLTYTILVPDASGGGATLVDTAGRALATGVSIDFTTPATRDPLALFEDPVPGPPTPLVRSAPGEPGCYLVFGGDTSSPIHFELDPFGVGRPPSGTLAPLNRYSDPASRVALYVLLDQPIDPSPHNVSPERIWIEYDANPIAGVQDWRPLATNVELVASCTDAGATLRLTASGVLPQARELRAVISTELTDLHGDHALVPWVDFAHFETGFFTDGAGAPLEVVDEVREEFEDAALADLKTPLPWPRARWEAGRLEASSGFEGSGGPGGDFDWHVPPSTTFVLDTTSTQILGGPGGVPTTVQTAVGGLVDVRDFFLPASSVLFVQGPNPCVIRCSGSARIEGEILAEGFDAVSVNTLDQPQIPRLGAAGGPGGGRGGVGSWATTTSTPRGGAGFGAFDVPLAGGEGGESGWSPDPSSLGAHRRAAGGGGGRLGHDEVLADGCPPQDRIGLDAESGFPGAEEANAATRPGETMPYGGHAGRTPFSNPTDSPEERLDDFFGVMVADFDTSPRYVRGELDRPWAGAGGGAGGDATEAASYPPPAFVFSREDQGAGGGGGGGSLSILALGEIAFGPAASISVDGGHGAGGENTSFQNRIGGGSGGGSGGHLILESATRIDLSAVPAGTAVLRALGGQGGAGANDLGGADGEPTPPALDAIHPGGGPPADNPWDASGCPGPGNAAVRGAGGDGGPGLIQLHAPDPRAAILLPTGPADLATLARPAPLGYDAAKGEWVHHLLPSFGQVSAAQSKWIPLGAVHAAPGTGAPDPVAFLFDGLDGTGRVRAIGGQVPDLPPLATATIGADASVEADGRTLRLADTALGADGALYLENPALLERFRLVAAGTAFEVVAASHDEAASELALAVDPAGPALPGAGEVRLVPRYFALSTAGAPDALPAPMRVRVGFQATAAGADGAPDLGAIRPAPGLWTSDPAVLTAGTGASEVRFYRFRVRFDLGAPPALGGPRPALEFLRVPFRF